MAKGLKGKSAGLLLGAAVVLVALGYLIWGGIGTNLVYFYTPTELLAKGSAAYDKSARLGGMVEAGTVVWSADARELRFGITDGDTTVSVVSVGTPPQMFTEGQGVVVEGVYTPEHVFRTNKLMIKHSNEYRAPSAGERPAEYYREMFKKQAS